jgi:hypothetical protein
MELGIKSASRSLHRLVRCFGWFRLQALQYQPQDSPSAEQNT